MDYICNVCEIYVTLVKGTLMHNVLELPMAKPVSRLVDALVGLCVIVYSVSVPTGLCIVRLVIIVFSFQDI